jgi:hypothetical protein
LSDNIRNLALVEPLPTQTEPQPPETGPVAVATPLGQQAKASFNNPSAIAVAIPLGQGAKASFNNPDAIVRIDDMILIFTSKKLKHGWRKLVACLFRSYSSEDLSAKDWCIRLDKGKIPTPKLTRKRKCQYNSYKDWYKADPNAVQNEFLRIREFLSEQFPF